MHTKTPAAPSAKSSLVTTLVVDSEPATRALLERVLATLGHDVVAVTSAADALIEASRRKLACIVLDAQQADTQAAELVEALIEHESGVAVIVLSGSNDAAAARPLFETALKSCSPHYIEYGAAKLELSTLPGSAPANTDPGTTVAH